MGISMILKAFKFEDISQELKSKKRIVLYGAGRMIQEMEIELPFLFDEKQSLSVIDGDCRKWNSYISIFNRTVSIENPNRILPKLDAGDAIILTVENFSAMLETIKECCGKTRIAVYLFAISRKLERDRKKIYVDKESHIDIGDIEMIPRKIHYFWVGKNPIPNHLMENVKRWRLLCPDYEIVLWNEENLNLEECRYAFQAYQRGKYGFVPDYFRLKVIYEHGGIYLDTDVELIKPLDSLLSLGGFAGFEDSDHVAFGLGFGARKGLPVLKEMYEEYLNVNFVDDRGELNLKSSPAYQTEVLKKYGLVADGHMQQVAGMTIFPMNYLAGQSYRTGLNYIDNHTISVHHYEAGWLSANDLNIRNIGFDWIKRLEDGEVEY